jgi:hypothetical protein
MLAPGEYLLKPENEKPTPVPPAGQTGEVPKPPAPAAEAEETEPRSFLLTLLRALGAIHT